MQDKRSLFLEALNEGVVCLDGAMGTLIQAEALVDADFGGSDFRMLGDLLSFSKPDLIRRIHRAYFEVGAHGVETNTFGASPFRLSEYDFTQLDLERFAPIPYGIDLRRLSHAEMAYHLSRRGAELACEAREEYRSSPAYDGRPLFVIGSIGPSNRVVSSTRADLQRATFDEIVENFRVQVLGLLDGGCDVLLYETQQDILEVKAAVFGGLRAMEERGVRLPIMCQVTVDAFGKMQIFNTDVHAAYVTVAGIGIDTFGMNCSIGPDLMERTVERVARVSALPISVLPNAGLPVSEGGRTVFPFTPHDFAQFQAKFVAEYGVNIVGGCCGTTPEHIRQMVEAVRGKRPKTRSVEKAVYVSGPQRAILLDSSETLIRIGERLNVRGSAKVRAAVEREGAIDHDALEEVVREQVEELGCNLIDVCMDSNVVDTVAALREVVHVQTTDFSGAMCLDSFQVEALAEAVKVYPGRPIINSISLEEVAPGVPKVDAVLEAVDAHNPLYIALCTGPQGPAATATEKLQLAQQILERAHDRYGVTPDRIFVDVNCFPIGSESEEGMNFATETLEGIHRVKEACPGVWTTLGVGNLTNGLAQKPYMRLVLTSVFLDEARQRGLDSAIINPNHYLFVRDLDPEHYRLGLRVILERDMEAFAALEEIAEAKKGRRGPQRRSYDEMPLEESICARIRDGFKQREEGTFTFRGHEYTYHDRIVLDVAKALERHAPLDFINEYLMRAMQDLGDAFGRGEVSLPHLLKSADVMRQAMGFLESYMRHEAGVAEGAVIKPKGIVVLGTVYQDVHSIGKDLARTLLENYGYRVIDLGTMVPLQQFIDTAREHQADAIGMSALLVQTSNHMITVSKMMREQGLNLPVLIGGAPVSERHAAYVALAGSDDRSRMRGDVFYCRTAMDGVNVMDRLMSEEDRTALYEENKKRLLLRLERAEQKQAEEEALLRTLPRRHVSYDHYKIPEEPRFRLRYIRYRLDEFVAAGKLDRKTLFSLNWRFGGAGARARTGHTEEELEHLLQQWVERASREEWIIPQGVMGIFPAQSEGDTVLVYAPEDHSTVLAQISFTVVLGAERKDVVSGAQYFPPVESGRMGAVGIQITGSGAHVDEVIESFKREGDSEAQLLLQGLSDRVAEDMAEHLHQLQRECLGLPADCGQRWSPGYPGLRDLAVNRILYALMQAGEWLGVRLGETGEFIPTGTTAAVVSYHPDARYT